MTPIFFAGRFGWLHAAEQPYHAGRLGVVLCPAYAQEEVCTHHGLMLLADRLAAAGMSTIRFDYSNTGDSADLDSHDGATLDTMVEDVTCAAECLRQECDVGSIALCGIRLGSAVAAQASAAILNVAGVVMLAPVISGEVFLRETRAAASVNPLAQLDPVPNSRSGLPLNTNGFRWSGKLQRQIAGLDLATSRFSVTHVLLATTRSDRRAPAFAAKLRERGSIVTDRLFADYDTYAQDPTTHTMPHATFAAVEAWLANLPCLDAAQQQTSPIDVLPSLSLDTCEEVPVRFGQDSNIFGIFCRPLVITGTPVAALLLHEGSSHHIGNGRAYVALARRLAKSGIASLRMDLSGMGDSPAGDNHRSPYFDPERRVEANAGVAYLAAAGYDKVVTFGLCAGAEIAYQTALADDRVVGTVMINLPKFVWNYGDDLRLVTRDSKRTMRSYIRSMGTVAAWRRALRGDGDLVGIARVLSRRAVERGVHSVRSLRPTPPGSERALVREQMRLLANRGVRMSLFYSDEDVGLAEMTRHFGRNARGLREFEAARMIVMNRADHHFNGSDVRARYLDIVDSTMRKIAEA